MSTAVLVNAQEISAKWLRNEMAAMQPTGCYRVVWRRRCNDSGLLLTAIRLLVH